MDANTLTSVGLWLTVIGLLGSGLKWLSGRFDRVDGRIGELDRRIEAQRHDYVMRCDCVERHAALRRELDKLAEQRRHD